MSRMTTAAVALIFPLLLGLALPASAQDAAAGLIVPGSARDWLELQKSGSAASPVARPVPGEIADRTFKRYADSFSQPIPETLNREEFLSKNSGGGGGGGK